MEAVARAKAELEKLSPRWKAQDLIPTEAIGLSNYDRGHRLYGIRHWSEFFAPRQLLALGVCGEELRNIQDEIEQQSKDEDFATALCVYLAMMMDKAVSFNTVQSRMQQDRGIRSIFDKHNYAMLWSYAEFDAASNLLSWSVSQVTDAYRDLVKLTPKREERLNGDSQQVSVGSLILLQDTAADLAVVKNESVHAVVTDPPYYDNVMYAELADFFYVWLKRTVGHLHPDWFGVTLTNKDDEAVANPARFADLGRKKTQLADRDYERKMAAAFREMHRVLKPEGVLTVMFTHKEVDAWDALATALIRSGFTIETSWPVHTESEHSLHQAKKNAARSTILLVCRKRVENREPTWWDDIQYEVRRTARETAERFAKQGIQGVDLYISTFGPVLSVASRHWPVLTREMDEKIGEPKPLRPETALQLAREEVVRLRKEGLLQGREVRFDPITDWYLMAWDAFQAVQFPADEARKLALALGLSVEDDLVRRKVLRKKGKDVELMTPKERRGRSTVNPDRDTFDAWIDAAHTAMLIYREDGGPACEQFLKRTGLRTDATFRALVEALLHAIPRTQQKGEFVRPEAAALESLRAAFFEDIEPPADPDEELVQQLALELQ